MYVPPRGPPLPRGSFFRGSLASAPSMLRDVRHLDPSLDFLKAWFMTWLKVDIETVAASFAIIGSITGAWSTIKNLIGKIYRGFARYLTASISIPKNDNLNTEIVNWIGENVLERRRPRVLAAKTNIVENNGFTFRVPSYIESHVDEKRPQINYLPTFETVWFFHDRNVFLVHRIFKKEILSQVPHEYAEPSKGGDPLVIMTLGRSVAPIQRLLDLCRDSAEKRKGIVVHTSDYQWAYWSNIFTRPLRPLDTVHFDEATKMDLIADIEKYLDPSTKQFYNSRGIPYRRGFLLHGPPGTDKTSLCLALASYFDLGLYLLHMPSVAADKDLEGLFRRLPPQCIVLMEDIDSIGMQRKSAIDEMEDEERRRKKNTENEDEQDEEDEEDDGEDDEEEDTLPQSRVTLSGLLNVLDGITSQEGRIVMMTSNFANRLDKALTRPGRIDRQVYLGNISPDSARLMFIRMFSPDSGSPDLSSLPDLDKLATEFSTHVPDNMFTPAELQEYLITHRDSAEDAVKGSRAWVEEQQRQRDEEEETAKRLAIWKAAKRKAAKKLEDAAAPKKPEEDAARKDVADDKAVLEAKVDLVQDSEASNDNPSEDLDATEDAVVEGDTDNEGEIVESDSEDIKAEDDVSKPVVEDNIATPVAEDDVPTRVAEVVNGEGKSGDETSPTLSTTTSETSSLMVLEPTPSDSSWSWLGSGKNN